MYCKCHRVNFKRGGLYINSPNWIKNKKIVALNFEEIESHPERVSNIIPFINKNNWEGINYPPKIDDWKTTEKNYSTIALNILYPKEN